MRTNSYVIQRFDRLARLVRKTVRECELNLRLSSEPFEAERLREDAKNIGYALRDAVDVLTSDAVPARSPAEGGAR
jgi:hypothetical protein